MGWISFGEMVVGYFEGLELYCFKENRLFVR